MVYDILLSIWRLVHRKLSICYINAGWFSHMQGGGMSRSGGYGDWRQRGIWKSVKSIFGVEPRSEADCEYPLDYSVIL